MDLSCFATKEMAEEGVILPVKINGTKIPLAIKVFGSDSDAVIEYGRARLRKFGLGKNGKNELDEDDIDELLENQDKAVVIRIGGIYAYDWKKKTVLKDEPVVLFGKTLGCDRKSYEYLIEKMPAIKDWITEQSNDRNNFLSDSGKKN